MYIHKLQPHTACTRMHNYKHVQILNKHIYENKGSWMLKIYLRQHSTKEQLGILKMLKGDNLVAEQTNA